MKRFIYFFFLLAFITGIVGCGDNTDVSSLHVLTDEEMAEIERQRIEDSIRQSQIDADLVLEYTVEAYYTENWGGSDKTLEIDLDAIGEVFGLTADEIKAGINKEDDAPEVKAFAIQGSTHADKDVASNTNGTWGHWWTTEGDVCDSYSQSNSALFVEWQGDYFTVGQYPGHLSEGFSVDVIEALRYQDKRVAIKITFKIVARGEVTAQIVGEENLSIDMSPNDAGDYTPLPLAFDYEQVLSALGMTAIDPSANLIAYKSAGVYEQEIGDQGWWFDKGGYVGAWGDDASAWISYGYCEDNQVGICLMPNATSVGDVYNHDFGFINGNKIYMLHITINVKAYEDPETPPAGNPVEATESHTFEITYGSDVDEAQYDVRDFLRNTFKMTTYELFSALNKGDLKIYVGEEGTEEPSYTATNGYWMNGNGESVKWGNENNDFKYYCELRASETSLVLAAGYNADLCSPNGETMTFTYVIVHSNGGKATINFTVNLKGSNA